VVLSGESLKEQGWAEQVKGHPPKEGKKGGEKRFVVSFKDVGKSGSFEALVPKSIMENKRLGGTARQIQDGGKGSTDAKSWFQKLWDDPARAKGVLNQNFAFGLSRSGSRRLSIWLARGTRWQEIGKGGARQGKKQGIILNYVKGIRWGGANKEDVSGSRTWARDRIVGAVGRQGGTPRGGNLYSRKNFGMLGSYFILSTRERDLRGAGTGGGKRDAQVGVPFGKGGLRAAIMNHELQQKKFLVKKSGEKPKYKTGENTWDKGMRACTFKKKPPRPGFSTKGVQSCGKKGKALTGQVFGNSPNTHTIYKKESAL